MTLSDLSERASAHEVGVVWPAFFRHRQREQDRQNQVTRGGPKTFQVA